MIVPAGIHVLELAALVVMALGVRSLEQEPFNLIGGVERVSLFLMKSLGVTFQSTADVGAVRRPILINDFPKYQHLAAAKHVRWRPIKGVPIHTQAKITFALRSKTADRGAIEGQVVEALYQEFLVIVQHVQTALKIAEQDRDRFNMLFIGQVLEAFFLNLSNRCALLALFFCFEI